MLVATVRVAEPLLWLRMEEGSDTNAFDSSSGTRHAQPRSRGASVAARQRRAQGIGGGTTVSVYALCPPNGESLVFLPHGSMVAVQ